eukprot:gb/GECG01006385.1/.p1 GENE.gb/GECG01006385.1/~~gb/GECG01006385.1/.p1  ORF type:complete len:108 (+),score=14.37 gb/GECG01006385.1/:1-324(+)
MSSGAGPGPPPQEDITASSSSPRAHSTPPQQDVDDISVRVRQSSQGSAVLGDEGAAGAAAPHTPLTTSGGGIQKKIPETTGRGDHRLRCRRASDDFVCVEVGIEHSY